MRKKSIKAMVVMLVAALVFTMMPLTVSAASKKPGKAKITSVKVGSVSKKKNTATVTVKWKKVSKATGYEIYAKHESNPKWSKIKKVGFLYRGIKIKKVPAGKVYIKVRAIRKVKGKVYKGKFSKVKTKFITGKWNLTKAMNANGGKKELQKLNKDLAKSGCAMNFSGNNCTLTFAMEKMDPSLVGIVLDDGGKRIIAQAFKEYVEEDFGGKSFARLLRDCSGVKNVRAVFVLKLNGDHICTLSYAP